MSIAPKRQHLEPDGAVLPFAGRRDGSEPEVLHLTVVGNDCRVELHNGRPESRGFSLSLETRGTGARVDMEVRLPADSSAARPRRGA